MARTREQILVAMADVEWKMDHLPPWCDRPNFILEREYKGLLSEYLIAEYERCSLLDSQRRNVGPPQASESNGRR